PRTETQTLSLHDALPIFGSVCSDERGLHIRSRQFQDVEQSRPTPFCISDRASSPLYACKPRSKESPSIAGTFQNGWHCVLRQLADRKSTRLNSSHVAISY